MIKEDFIVFNSGIFKRSFNIARAMHDMYLEKFSDEMSALVEDIWEDIEKIINKKPSRNSSRGQLSSRNQSTESLQSNKSFNSITAAMEKLPRDYIAAIANVVNSILYIEEHVEKLIQTSAWDASGLPSKKLRRKGSLKGNLLGFFYAHLQCKYNVYSNFYMNIPKNVSVMSRCPLYIFVYSFKYIYIFHTRW
jgi:hypothetical protein